MKKKKAKKSKRAAPIALPQDPAAVATSSTNVATAAQKNITTPCRKCGKQAELFPKIGGPTCRKCATKGK